MTNLELIIIILAGVALFYIGKHIGYRAGWEDGREHELDKAAKRHVRMSRFRNMENKPNHWSDIING